MSLAHCLELGDLDILVSAAGQQVLSMILFSFPFKGNTRLVNRYLLLIYPAFLTRPKSLLLAARLDFGRLYISDRDKSGNIWRRRGRDGTFSRLRVETVSAGT